MNLKYDYATLEAEFVREPGVSIRELARRHGIPQERVSSLHDRARKPDASGLNWYQKRERFEAQSETKALSIASDKEARRRARLLEVRDHAVEVIDRYLTAAERDINATVTVTRDGKPHREPMLRVAPKDISRLMEKLQPLFEMTSPGMNLPEVPDFDAAATLRIRGSSREAAQSALAGLAAFAHDRSRGVDRPAVGGSSLSFAPDPRPDEQS